MARRILVLHGPTMNLEAVLGRTFPALEEALNERAAELGLELENVQANGEGALLDALVEHHDGLAGVVVAPGSLAPIAYGLADALEALALPCIEVQLRHESKARGKSALRRVVDKQFHGHGVDGYFKALGALAKAEARPAAAEAPTDAEPDETPVAHRPNGKSIGRKPVAATPTNELAPSSPSSRKSIGRTKEPASSSPTPGKSIGRSQAGSSSSGPVVTTGSISRALVREKLTARLGGKVSGDELAQWARGQWVALQNGASVEPGQQDKLEEVLLILSTSAKASDHVILTYAAKLER